MDDATTGQPPFRAPAEDAARREWLTARLEIERGRRWVSPRGSYARWPARLKEIAARAAASSIGFCGLGARGRRNALDPRLVELELSFAALPAAFDGYRILQLSDTHLDALPGLAPIAARLAEGLAVDLLAVTGDILAKPGTPPARALAPLGEIVSRVSVRDRRVAVLGNHDPAAMADALEAEGFEVLLNRSIVIDRGGASIIVTGLDDVHAFYTEAADRALFRDAGGFRIALVHSGEMADRAAASGVALYLCGHTHGGQFCLPGGRPIITQLKRCHHAARGLWRDGAMLGYTSRGLGVSGQKMRFNCPSEMTLVTLRRRG